MKKLKSLAPILKFLRELSVVATGIIITVGLGLWVNSKNNKNDLKLYLDAVVMELEKNAEMFDRYAEWMQKSARYAEYIQSNDKNALNKDSLEFYKSSTSIYMEGYFYGCGYLQTISFVDIFRTNAFEMLKNSGTMHQIKDKELLLSIWDAYGQVESLKYNIETAFQIKREVQMRDEILLAEGKPVVVPMEIFYKYDQASSIVYTCQYTSERLKETLSKLKESKLVKQ